MNNRPLSWKNVQWKWYYSKPFFYFMFYNFEFQYCLEDTQIDLNAEIEIIQ